MAHTAVAGVGGRAVQSVIPQSAPSERVSAATRLALIARAQKGDTAALLEYRQMNRGLFEKTLRRYARWASDSAQIDDMRQEGELGLLKGIQSYNVERSNNNQKPEGYVYSWVRAYIANYARNHGIREASNFVSETRYDHDNEEEYSLFDTIEAEDCCTETKYQHGEVQKLFHDTLGRLLPKEREVASRRLFCEDPETLEDVGASMGVSRERVRQIEIYVRRKVVRRLEKKLKEYGVKHAELEACGS